MYDALVNFSSSLRIDINIVEFTDKMLFCDNCKETAKYNILFKVLEKNLNNFVANKRKEELEIEKMMNRKK